MLKKAVLGILGVIGAVCIYAGLQPSQMLVSREILIAAPAETIFPYINDSRKANDWMPWKDSDPGVVMTYSGPGEGVGSKSSWNSTGQMGTGEAIVVESVPNQRVQTKLTYTKPFEMSQLAEISLSAEGSGTKVKWSVSGEKNFFFRLMGVFFDCDKMIGGEFEKGLSKLNEVVTTKR